MAKETSPAIEEKYRFPHLAHLHLKIKGHGLRSRWRNTVRRTFPSAVRGGNSGVAAVSENFEKTRDFYRKNHWAYVEDFWGHDFHQKLIEHWPAARFFTPIRYITKAYDMGMAWSVSIGSDPEFLETFPAYKAAYNFLRSREFCRRVAEQCGDGIERKCYQLLLTRAYWGSNVIPHIDASNRKTNVNLVIFINGSGGPRGGGLGIWRDNEFENKIFEPYNLRNACIYYDMSEAFYHGFEPMRFGSFRWTINATYSGADRT